MSMFTQAGIVLATMVAVYVAVRALRVSTELAMFGAAIGGALVAGVGFPARHVAEGAATYLDINLIFVTATLFMNLLKESGGVAFVVRSILRRFHRSRALLLVLLTVLLLVPGALTGAGSVTVLVAGSLVAVVLGSMGLLGQLDHPRAERAHLLPIREFVHLRRVRGQPALGCDLLDHPSLQERVLRVTQGTCH